MKSPSPLPLPLKGLGHRIGRETGYLVVVALVKPHALALQQVNGGDDVHGQTRRCFHHGSLGPVQGVWHQRQPLPA